MGAPKIPMTNFTKGEAAPDLYSRVDIPQYGALARKINNFIIQRQGGLKLRPGFRYVADADSVDGEERMIPFLYRQDQAFIQVFSAFKSRAMTSGGLAVEEDLKIVSTTSAGEMVVEVPFHGLVEGDRVFLDGNEGQEELNGQYAAVAAVIDANHVKLNINNITYGALTGSSGIVRVAPPPAPPSPPAPLPPPPDPPTTPDATDSGGSDLGGGEGGHSRFFNKLYGGV